MRAYERTIMCVTCSTPSLRERRAAGRASAAASGARQPWRSKTSSALIDQVVGVLEAVGVRQDLPVGELLGRLALARRGRRQPGEDALGIGLRAAGEQAEAVELRGEVVEQEAARAGGRARVGRRRRRQRAGAARADLRVGPS